MGDVVDSIAYYNRADHAKTMEFFSLCNFSLDARQLSQMLDLLNRSEALHTINFSAFTTPDCDLSRLFGPWKWKSEFNTRIRFQSGSAITKGLLKRIGRILKRASNLSNVTLTVQFSSSSGLSRLLRILARSRSLITVRIELSGRPQQIHMNHVLDIFRNNQNISDLKIIGDVRPRHGSVEDFRADFDDTFDTENKALTCMQIKTPHFDLAEGYTECISEKELKRFFRVGRIFCSFHKSPRIVPFEIIERIFQVGFCTPSAWQKDHFRTIFDYVLDKRTLGKLDLKSAGSSRNYLYSKCRQVLAQQKN